MGKNQNNPGIQLEATEENSQTSPASLETPEATSGKPRKPVTPEAWRRRKAQKAQNNREWTRIDANKPKGNKDQPQMDTDKRR